MRKGAWTVLLSAQLTFHGFEAALDDLADHVGGNEIHATGPFGERFPNPL